MLEDSAVKESVEITNSGVIRSLLKPLSILFIGLIFGSLLSAFLMSSNIEILYISQDELINLEKSRIEKTKNSKDLELFNGQVERAIGLIEDIAQSYESSSSKVVFSRGPVNGNNVRSISSDIHTQLLEELAYESKELK